MDSEDEDAEANGEDLDFDQKDGDEEDNESQDSEEGSQFIVSDGHLSVGDISMDGSEDEKLAEIARRRK